MVPLLPVSEQLSSFVNQRADSFNTTYFYCYGRNKAKYDMQKHALISRKHSAVVMRNCICFTSSTRVDPLPPTFI